MVSATARATRTDPLARVLLRRSGPAVAGLLTGTKVKDRGLKSVGTAQGLVALEADVLARGYLVGPVSPCAHLVCENCWDMGNYSGCPIRHRRCDSFQDSLVPDEPATDPRVPLPRRAAVLEIAEDVTGAVFSAVGKLLARRTPPSPQDRDDLAVMLDFATLDADRVELLDAADLVGMLA